MSFCTYNPPPLDFISDMDIVGRVCAFSNKLLEQEDWVACIERIRKIYLKVFHRGGWADRMNVPEWVDLIYDQNERWDEMDLRFKFVKFLEIYPVGGGSRQSKTRLYWESKERPEWRWRSRMTLAQAIMYDTVYGLRIYRHRK